MAFPLRQLYPLLVLLTLFGFIFYPAVNELFYDWSHDANYSHGFIIPLISGYLIWENWEKIEKIPLRSSFWGIAVLFMGLILYIVGNIAGEWFTMRIAMLVVFGGILLTLYGGEFFKAISLPYGYLYFMIPLPYLVYDAVAFPLKVFVAKYSVATLQAGGISVYREGNIIMLPHIVLEVADACSGIRSLISLLALGVAMAYFTQEGIWKRLFLVLSAIPIAVAANGIRVVGTGFLAQFYGAKAAEGFFHEFAGLVIFFCSFLLMGGVAFLLTKIRRKAVA